jgi:hypothetical protein
MVETLAPNGANHPFYIGSLPGRTRHLQDRRDVKVFYITRCWQHPVPKLKRSRESTIFGFELLNPRTWPEDQADSLIDLALRMIGRFTVTYNVRATNRHNGFEIVCEQLGMQRKVCTGRPYSNGHEFWIRVMLL